MFDTRGGSPSQAKRVAVTLRQAPGALVLGLAAALLGHAALFHGDHAMGGAYNGLLLQAGGTAAFALVGTLAALLVNGAKFAADGSVLASRIAARLPGFPMLAASTLLWFSLGERIEPQHGATPLPLTLLALVIATFAIAALARGIVRWLAQAVFGITRSLCHPELVEGRLNTYATPGRAQRDTTGRRFARPPPIVANCRA